MAIGRAIVGFGAAFGALVMLSGPLPLAAQQDSVTYVGELTGSCSGFRGRPVQIEVQRNRVRGTVARSGGDHVRFSGDLKDSRFNIKTQNQTPFFISGAVKGDIIRATFQREECSYNAVLKKKV